jgi:uncharacterized protein
MRFVTFAALIATAVIAASPIGAQTPQTTPSPEAIAAARELIQVTHATDQFKIILPTLFQSLKAAIVQNRPEVEKAYDAMIPIFNQKAEQRLDELTTVIATVYANNFTVDEIHDITAFFHSPTGQKFVQRQQTVIQQSMAAGQQFGREIASDVQQEMSQHQ